MKLQSNLDYLKLVFCVRSIFELDFSVTYRELTRLMNQYSKNMEYELANSYLHKLNSLNELEKKLEPIRVRRYNKVAWNIKKTLGLKNIPLIIEAFDNSHNQGECNVAASVRYVNNKPQKSEYRKYIIKDVDNNGDDCASFEEVIYRRFTRILKEKGQLPNLVLIDGGKGQLNSTRKVMEELGLMDKVDVISISKNDKHRSSIIHTICGKQIPMNFTELGVIQEEIHRFAIKFHRERSGKILLKK